MHWLYWIYYLVLLVVMFSGLVLNLLTMPGIWLLTVGVFLYEWATGFQYAGKWTLLTLVIIGLMAEIIEFLAGGAGAKKAGGSRLGGWGAIAGSLVGAIVGGIVIPVPLVGSVIGVIAGAFLGAGMVEYCLTPDHGRAMRIGAGAAKGRFMGMIAKTIFGLVMFMIGAWMCLPIGGSASAAPSAGSTSPQTTTLPASQQTITPDTPPATLPAALEPLSQSGSNLTR